MTKDSTKSNIHYSIPGKLWKLLKKHLPKPPKVRGRGRPPVNNRDVINGIWHVLWTGCQWKSIQTESFGVSSSVLSTSEPDGLRFIRKPPALGIFAIAVLRVKQKP